jgi:ribosome maturation factor RimP
MAGDVAEQIRVIASRIAGSYGLDIFAVQFRREGQGMVLRVQIDRPGSGATEADSVSVEDCARVSRDLSAVLDVDDVVPTAYTLEVSSPGLDRPLVQIADYVRFAGRRAKVVMRKAVDGQMFLKGRIGGVGASGAEESVVRDSHSETVIIVTDDGRPHRVPFDTITRANLEVEF